MLVHMRRQTLSPQGACALHACYAAAIDFTSLLLALLKNSQLGKE